MQLRACDWATGTVDRLSPSKGHEKVDGAVDKGSRRSSPRVRRHGRHVDLLRLGWPTGSDRHLPIQVESISRAAIARGSTRHQG